MGSSGPSFRSNRMSIVIGARGRDEPRVSTWRLHDAIISLSVSDHLWDEAIRPLFDALPLAPSTEPTTRASFCLEIRRGPEGLPRMGDGSRCEPGFGLEIVSDSGATRVTDGASWFYLDTRRNRGILVVDPGFPARPAKARLDLLLIGLNEWLATRGWFDLHAAALVRETTGLLLVGGSGTGKSTATLALVSSGWRFLSDDAVLLADEDPVRVLSFREPFNVDPRLADLYPEIADHLAGPPDPETGKRFLDLARALPGRHAPACVPNAILFTGIADRSRTRIEPVSSVDALARLVAQSPSLAFRSEFARAHMQVLRRLVSQAACFRLAAGRDVRDDPSLLADRVDAIIGPSCGERRAS